MRASHIYFKSKVVQSNLRKIIKLAWQNHCSVSLDSSGGLEGWNMSKNWFFPLGPAHSDISPESIHAFLCILPPFVYIYLFCVYFPIHKAVTKWGGQIRAGMMAHFKSLLSSQAWSAPPQINFDMCLQSRWYRTELVQLPRIPMGYNGNCCVGVASPHRNLPTFQHWVSATQLRG